MVTQEEVEKIRTWIRDWFPEMTFTSNEIQDMCRGAFKDVLLNFLVPQFRTDEQIMVIRDNLYLNGFRQTPASGLDAHEEEVLKLETKLEEVTSKEEEALESVLKESKILEGIQEKQARSKLKVRSEMEDVAQKKDELAKVQELIYICDGLINNVRPLMATDSAVYATKEEQYESFEQIHQEAISLFDDVFLHERPVDAPALIEKSKRIEQFVKQVVHGKLSWCELVRWNREGVAASVKYVEEVVTAAEKFQTNPSEKLIKETRRNKSHLCSEHVRLHNKNADLEGVIKETERLRKEAEAKAIQQILAENERKGEGDWVAYFMQMIRQEELGSKAREVESLLNENMDRKHINPVQENWGNSFVPHGESLIFHEGSFQEESTLVDHSTISQEKLERLSLGLMRSWPATKAKFEDTIRSVNSLPTLHTLDSEKGPVETQVEPDSEEEPSWLLALNPNKEKGFDKDFVDIFNQNLPKVAKQEKKIQVAIRKLEESQNKTGSANLEIMKQLIEDVERNMRTFN